MYSEYGAKASTNSVKEHSTLGDFVNSIDGHLSAAHDILQRIDKLADRVGGSVPRDASSEGQPVPEEVALNPRLRRKLNQLGNLQAAISAELSRLENSV